ncbi:hypothetical protein KR067_012717, partial [Drosophila pandora]
RNRFSNRRLIFQSHINEILQLRVVEPGSVATLRELSDRFNGHMRALMSSGSAAEIQGCLLIQIVLQKLDPATRAKWEDTLAGNNDSLPSWESMARFLEQRCRTLECVDFSLAAYPPSNQVGRGRSSNNRSSCMIINARPALCALCGIMNLRAVESASATRLCELSDKFNSHMRALASMGTTKQIASCIIIQVLLQKVENATQSKWKEMQADSESLNSIPTWETIASFLEQRCRTLESLDVPTTSQAPNFAVGRRRPFHPGNSAFVITNSSAWMICDGHSHVINSCLGFLSLSPEDRLGEVRRFDLCRKCLGSWHLSRQCNA